MLVSKDCFPHMFLLPRLVVAAERGAPARPKSPAPYVFLFSVRVPWFSNLQSITC